MSNRELHHLFIFEGEREGKYVESLEQHFLQGDTEKHIKCIYKTDIYQLFKQMSVDNFAIDIVTLLKGRDETLKDYNQDSFAGIYLFFDYDGHATEADDSKIMEMLKYFNNETENGLLFLSYPMLEAIRHYTDKESFKDLVVKCKAKNCPNRNNCSDVEACDAEDHYKKQSSDKNKFNDIRKYTPEIWKELIKAHVYKMNYLVSDSYTMPTDIVTQSTIFEKQLEKYIKQQCPKVAVLSAFPLYILNHYGAEKLNEKLNRQTISSK